MGEDRTVRDSLLVQRPYLCERERPADQDGSRKNVFGVFNFHVCALVCYSLCGFQSKTDEKRGRKMEGVLRVAICDDRSEDLERIEAAVKDGVVKVGIEEHVECHSFLNGEGVSEADHEPPFDLVLLDIELEDADGEDGFTLANRLHAQRKDICLIFVSLHENFVWNAQKYMPLWFVRESVLKKDMEDALESLKALEEELKAYHFLRIHKNYLVNPRYVEEVGKWEIRLTDGNVLEMGRDEFLIAGAMWVFIAMVSAYMIYGVLGLVSGEKLETILPLTGMKLCFASVAALIVKFSRQAGFTKNRLTIRHFCHIILFSIKVD